MSGLYWQSGGGVPNSRTSEKTANFDASASYDIYFCSNAITATLPIASQNNGKVFTIQKRGAVISEIITISGTGLTTTLNTEDETVQVVSDGTIWRILTRNWYSAWVPYTPSLTGFGTASNVSFMWRRVGGGIEILGKFTIGTPTAVEARCSLPTGMVSMAVGSLPTLKCTGSFVYSVAGALSGALLIEPGVSYLTFGIQDNSRAGLTKANGSGMSSAGDVVSLYGTVPIEGFL